MNISIVCWEFDRSSILRQPWRQIFEISRRLVRMGNAVTVITDGVGRSPSVERIDGIRIRRIGHKFLSLFFLRGKIRKAILKDKPDVVIWCGDLLTALFIPTLKIEKPLLHFLDSDVYDLRSFMNINFREIIDVGHRFLWRQVLTVVFPIFILKEILNSSIIERILVPSKYLKTTLTDLGISKRKIVLFPSAIDKRQFQFAGSTKSVRKKLEVESDSFIVTYFGSPCTLRGTDTLICSLKILKMHGEKTVLVLLSRRDENEERLLGHSLRNEEKHLQELAKSLGVAQHTRVVTGILDRKMLRQYLSVSDVIVLPFKLLFSEFPLSILEAMTMGKTVITTNIGTLAEFVNKDRGILIRPNDPNALAMAILSIIKDPKKSELLGRKAQEFAFKLPKWTQITCGLLKLLNKTQKKFEGNKIEVNLYRRLCLKTRWKIWKKNPIAIYRRKRLYLAYKLFGVRKFPPSEKTMHIRGNCSLGVDEFGRSVAEGVLLYTELLKRRGLKLRTVLVLGSRAKGCPRPSSDVDVVLISSCLPKGLRRKFVLSEAPIFMGIQPHALTENEFLQNLESFKIGALDAVYYGKVMFDDGFWSLVEKRKKILEKKHKKLKRIKKIIRVL